MSVVRVRWQEEASPGRPANALKGVSLCGGVDPRKTPFLNQSPLFKGGLGGLASGMRWSLPVPNFLGERATKTRSFEVSRMKSVDEVVDGWVREEDLPGRPGLRAIRVFDGLYPEDEDERGAYWDFIGWFMGREWALLECVPVKKRDGWFPPVQIEEVGPDMVVDVSHFNTKDFERMSGFRFDFVHWRHRAVLERVKDLAITHSVLSNVGGKQRTFERFRRLVEGEYRDEAVMIAEHLRRHGVWLNRERAAARIEVLNRKIRDCKRVWNEVVCGD